MPYIVGRSGALVESVPFDRSVVGSNPALAAAYRDLGQVIHLQLPVALRRVNSDTLSIAVVGTGESFWKAQAVRSAIEMDKYNTIHVC